MYVGQNRGFTSHQQLPAGKARRPLTSIVGVSRASQYGRPSNARVDSAAASVQRNEQQSTHHGSQLSAKTLVGMTQARQQPPIGDVPVIKRASYNISQLSSVTKANQGKIEHLGTFMERADRIKHASSSTMTPSGLFTNYNSTSHQNTFKMLPQASTAHMDQVTSAQYNSVGGSRQKLRQPRGRSQLQLKAHNERQIQIEANQYLGAFNTNLSSNNIKSSKYHTKSGGTASNKSLFLNQSKSFIHKRLNQQQQRRSIYSQNSQGNYQDAIGQPQTSLQRLIVSSDGGGIVTPNSTTIDYGQVTVAPSSDHNETKYILTKNANMQSQGIQKGGGKRRKSGSKVAGGARDEAARNQRVLYSVDQGDEKVKLVVQQNSFTDVIQAMYSNDLASQQATARRQESARAEDQQAQPQPTARNQTSTLQEQDNGAAAYIDKVAVEGAVDGALDGVVDGAADGVSDKDESALSELDKTGISETNNQVLAPTMEKPSDNPTSNGASGVRVGGEEIKMMDTITFISGFQPVQWIFTDLMGKIQSKEISQITINEVIKAFLINLNHNKKADFSNDDLLQFLDTSQINQKICFAIKGQSRELLDIKDLLDLRAKYPKGIDALQLFKIPTRSFLPFYFHHILAFDQMGRPLRSTLVRMPINEVQQQMDRQTLASKLESLKTRAQFIQDRIQAVSNDVVARLTAHDPIVLLNIVIVYLLEEEAHEPWFIGTQKCEVLTQKVTSNKGKKKKQTVQTQDWTADAANQHETHVYYTEASVLSQSQHPHDTPTVSTKQMSSPDSPTKIQIIETQIQNLNPSGGSQAIQRGGRTSSTTTVFQKLDSRSHLTHKNQTHDGVEGHGFDDQQYMFMINGGDDNVQAILLNKDNPLNPQAPASAARLHDQIKNDVRISGIFSQDAKGKMSCDDGVVTSMRQPNTQLMSKGDLLPYSSNLEDDALYQSQGSKRKPHTFMKSGAVTTSGGMSAAVLEQPINDSPPLQANTAKQQTSHDSSVYRAQNPTQLPREESQQIQVQQQAVYESSKSLSQENVRLDAVHDDRSTNLQADEQEKRDSAQRVRSQISTQKLEKSPIPLNQQTYHGERTIADALGNDMDLVEELREGMIFKEDEVMADQDPDYFIEVAAEEQELNDDSRTEFQRQQQHNPQRGRSALEQKGRQPLSMGVSTAQQSGQTSQATFTAAQMNGQQSRHMSAICRPGMVRVGGRSPQNEQVYILESNELLTANELFTGLAKVGQDYGRGGNDKYRLYHSQPKLTSTKAARSNQAAHYGSQNQGLKVQGVPSSTKSGGKKVYRGTMGKVQAFLHRQERLKASSDELKAQRMLIKPQGKRLLNLFPQYLDKSASRQHSKFLFGDAEQHKVFRDYRHAMSSVENQVRNLGDCMLPQSVIKDELKMLQVAKHNNARGAQIFNMKMSEVDDAIFLSDVIGDRPNQKSASTAQGGFSHQQNGMLIHEPAINVDYEMPGLDLSSQPHNNLDLVSLSQCASLNQPQKSFVDRADLQGESTPQEDTFEKKPTAKGSIEMQPRKRDFLKDTLLEARVIFKRQSTKMSMISSLDKEAIALIEAEKQLEGVAVADTEKVIHDFRCNSLFQPVDPGYNLTGQVPKVSHDLAQKYVEMRSALRQRRALEEKWRRAQGTGLTQNMANYTSTTGGSYNNNNITRTKSAISSQRSGTNRHRSNRAQFSAKQTSNKKASSKQFLHVSGHELDRQAANHDRRPSDDLDQFIGEPDVEIRVRDAEGQPGVLGIAELATEVKQSYEMRFAPLQAHPQPQSIETMDQAPSDLQHMSDALQPFLQASSGSAGAIKCSLGLCCDNKTIQLSKEMQIQDTCYIQQHELSKARDFLLRNQTEDTVIRYSAQFNHMSSDNNIQDQNQAAVGSMAKTEGLIEQSQISVQNPLVASYEPSKKEVAVGNSTALESTSVAMGAASQLGGAYNDKNRYELFTDRVVKDSVQAISSSIIDQRRSQGVQLSPLKEDSIGADEEQMRVAKSVSLQGVEAVRRMTQMVLSGFKGEQKEDSSAEVQVEETDHAASIILEPIEKLAGDKTQIFTHENNSAKVDSPDGVASRSVRKSGNQSEQPRADSQLQQLGIHHVKLEEENWVPSPELVPCCVRCFSIATYVLNYELNSD